jgi:glycosyltransferase involved in cell wall biosynthesis
MTTVSVVIPLYNRENSIEATVDSVLKQSVPVHEIVIVDDASKDNSVEVVRALEQKHPQVKLIALAQNGGGGRARNAGIDAATGELLALLDSDDLWKSNKLERQLAAIAGSEGSAFICFTNLEVDRHDGTPIYPWNTKPFPEDGEVKKFKLAMSQVVQTSTLLLPTPLARKVRFRDTLRRNQDDDFVYRAAAMGVTFLYVDEPLVRYDADDTAVRTSSRKNLRPLLDWLNISKEYLTEPERAHYYMEHMFRAHWEDSRLEAFRRGSGFFLRGHVPPMAYARAVAGSLVPSGLKKLLRRG